MKKYIIMTVLLFFITSCVKEMRELDYLNKEIGKIYILYLDVLETEDILEDEHYVNNRKIIKKIELTKPEKETLIRTILKKENYEPLTRKCKFEPVYAIKIDSKIVALFDVKYCPALEYYEKDGKKKMLQLKTKSLLKKEIEKLIK